MRTLLIKSAILLACVSLIGCSTNTRQGNTAVGAATGAVVGGLAGSAVGGGVGAGVGAVTGAVVGGLIGNSMDSSDNRYVYNTMNTNAPNRATTWTNPRTGVTYRMVPTSRMMTMHGVRNCRRFYTTATINGKRQRVQGIVCKQADGTWTTMRS